MAWMGGRSVDYYGRGIDRRAHIIQLPLRKTLRHSKFSLRELGRCAAFHMPVLPIASFPIKFCNSSQQQYSPGR
jgi:hypothetical protein